MIIAEIGWNFLGDINLAKTMIASAKESGCEYIKFQLWDPKTLKKGPWDEDGRREIYNKAFLNDDQYKDLYEYSKSLKIDCFASVFSDNEFHRLLNVSNKIIKIPSMEAWDDDLISKSIQNFELVIISTGAMKKNELENLRKYSDQTNVVVLHCVSSYPLDYKNFNYEKFSFIKNNFKRFGYSGHCDGIEDAIFALSNDAEVVEKHFTTDRNLEGRDNKFAIMPDELRFICDYQKKTKEMKISNGLDLQEFEQDVYKNYRSRWRK